MELQQGFEHRNPMPAEAWAASVDGRKWSQEVCQQADLFFLERFGLNLQYDPLKIVQI